MKLEQAEQILAQARAKTILVAGDLMLDEYLWGATDRISPEAPVPVVSWGERTFAPGGAANVVANVTALGARAVACGVVGDDNSAVELRRELDKRGVDLSAVVTVPGRLTTRKTRVFARSQQLLRVDRETTDPVPEEVGRALAAAGLEHLDSVDAVLFSDYAKGALQAPWVREVIEGCLARRVLVAAGPKPATAHLYPGATFVSLNRVEAEELCGAGLVTDDDFATVGEQLLDLLQATSIVVTRGPKGAMLFSEGGVSQPIPPKPVQVFDECGAGDTFLTAAVLALSAGASPEAATEFGNLAAAVVVHKVGVSPATPEEILELCAEA